MKEYKTISKCAQSELTINKSRFIGSCSPASCEEEALEFIEKVKKEYKDASHNVFAYIIGSEMNIQRFSDDKEPSGTAGLPIIELLKKEDITNIVIVVTRYYGGIQLGAGGLIRAYSKSARLVLENAEVLFKRIYIPIKLVLDYNFWGKVQNDFEKQNIRYDEPEYAEKVYLKIYVKTQKVQGLLNMITNITSADFTYEIMQEIYLEVCE